MGNSRHISNTILIWYMFEIKALAFEPFLNSPGQVVS